MEKKYTFKRIILLELCILFLASAFPSDKNPGWVVQSVPTNKLINDIFFINSLRGWAVTAGGSDTNSIILNTTNGGTNWMIQYSIHWPNSLNAIQFVDSMNGYAVGGYGLGNVLKTTNAGNNWNTVLSAGSFFYDVFFVNKDTGWVSDNDNLFGIGLIKTTNGGQNWFQQLGAVYSPSKIFFINRDTGWIVSGNTKLYRTTNSGQNWNLQFTSQYNIQSLFFLNKYKGWMRGGYTSGTMGVAYTTDGGFTWINAQGTVGGFDIKFVNDSIGYSGIVNYHVTKSIDGGKHWGNQNCPIYSTVQISAMRNDTSNVWAGETGIAHTTDGGGPIMQITNSNEQIAKRYELYQNYPNPFNQCTIINVQLSIAGNVELNVYDISGKFIKTLINKKQKSGKYEIKFDGGNLSSGIYFYSFFVDGVRVDTKKMILIK